MERGHRRSKSASAFEGFPQVQKYRPVSRLPSASDSYVTSGIRNDKLVQIGQSSVGQANDRPSANLLAGRIYKEIEPKKRSLGGIARLLRRKGLPSLWNTHKQKKSSSDSYRPDNTSINVEPNRQLYDGQPIRRSPKKQQEFEDVYEDEDWDESSLANGRYSSRWSASSMLSKSEMALIQKNLESKRLTIDETISEKFYDLEELDGMLGSGVLRKQFGRKNISFVNHAYDQRGTSTSSLGSPTALLNPPISAKYGAAKSRRADKDITGKHNITYHPNNDDGLLLDPDYRHRARVAHNISYSQEKNKKNTPPTPIIVLKPKLGDVQNHHGLSPYHSQGHSPNSANMTGFPSVESAKELSWRKSESYYDAEFMKPEEAGGLANRITRRFTDACESEDRVYSGLRESVIEETLCGAKESDIDGELEMFKPSFRRTVGDDKRGSHPSPRSVNEEAKKRHAERWKLTHRYRDLEIVGKGSTLGEMLSIPHGDQKSKQTAYSRIDRSSAQMGADNRSSIRHGLLGTFSRGGSKNKIERPSRSRSVPPIGGSIRGRATCHDMLGNEKHVMHSEPISHGTSKVSKPYPSRKDHFSFQGLKFKGKRPLPSEEIDSSVEARFEIQMEAHVKDLPPQQLTFQMAEKDDCRGSDDVSEIVADDAEHGITTLLSRTSLLHSNHSSVDNESTGYTADDQKVFCPQELNEGVSKEVAPSSNSLEAEPVSSGSSRNAEHASLIPVLETPSVEDASSRSDSSVKVSAEVNDLTMQLHLLKMDSSAYDNTSTHIPMERDTIKAESWEASYALDVLILQNFGFDLFRIMWHTPHHPLDSRLFDILEEKYCSNEMAGSTSRPQRMLLFDRINSALSDIFLKHVDILPWAMPKLAGLMQLMRQKERAGYSVERLIGSANGLQVTERILDREMHWPDPTKKIALTGNEIEELLLDDLINEFLFDQ